MENMLDEAVGTLADIAFSTDLDAESMRKKAEWHYYNIRIATDPDDESILDGAAKRGITQRKEC